LDELEPVKPIERRRGILPVRLFLARPRLALCLAAGIFVGLLLPHSWRPITRMLITWNLATVAYVLFVGIMMIGGSSETIKRRAAQQDEGRLVVLTLAIVAATASIFAIVAQLATVKEAIGWAKYLHLGLAAVTIVSSWFFVQTMFALHYAHEYYDEWEAGKGIAKQLRGGLDFPGTPSKPDYADFLYFSFVIGVASQTADVNVTSKAMRRVALVHCVLSFFFNTTILALTINIAAGLI
jgi:uncharacterized membrane protein